MPVIAHTRQGRLKALARTDRLAADLGSPVKPMLAHILAWRRQDRLMTIEILDQLSVSPRSLPIGIRRSVSGVWPKLIVSQSLRLSEFLGSGNQEAD